MSGERTYIGDSLYAEFDDYGIRLSTNRGDIEHWVYLEPDVWANLLQFVKSLGGPQ